MTWLVYRMHLIGVFTLIKHWRAHVQEPTNPHSVPICTIILPFDIHHPFIRRVFIFPISSFFAPPTSFLFPFISVVFPSFLDFCFVFRLLLSFCFDLSLFFFVFFLGFSCYFVFKYFFSFFFFCFFFSSSYKSLQILLGHAVA